ncbi:MAG: TIGR02186 family protein [Rhodomicrobium sp.]
MDPRLRGDDGAAKSAPKIRLRNWFRLGACFLAFWLAPLAAEAAPASAAVPDSIEAEASENYFYIEPGYNGSSIVLFGSIDREKLRGKPIDVAVTIKGPIRPVTVWKKGRHAGLWINTERLTFEGVPNYYAVLSTKPAAEIAALEERKAHGVGLDALTLPLQAGDGGKAGAAAPEEFQKALIRLKQSSGLFLEQSRGGVEFLGSRLFRSHIYLPASAGAGLYRAEFYIYQNGKIVGETGSDILLSKVGIEAELSAAALDFPWLYGAIAVILAALTGGGASLIFRKT